MSQMDTSVNRVSQVSQSTESHVQTDRRTNTDTNTDCDILRLSDAHAGVQADDVIAGGLA